MLLMCNFVIAMVTCKLPTIRDEITFRYGNHIMRLVLRDIPPSYALQSISIHTIYRQAARHTYICRLIFRNLTMYGHAMTCLQCGFQIAAPIQANQRRAGLKESPLSSPSSSWCSSQLSTTGERNDNSEVCRQRSKEIKESMSCGKVKLSRSGPRKLSSAIFAK